MTTFTESRTLGIDKHSARSLCRVSNAQRTTPLGKGPSTAVYSWRPLTLPSATRWHSAKKLLCRVSPDRYSTNYALPSVYLGHSTKYIFIFFLSQPNFLWFVPTLCRLTCSIFGTFIKVFAITIRFCLFNWISLDNSDLNCKSLETRKIVNVKIIFMLFSTSYDDFSSRPEFSSTMLTKHDRELSIQLFKNCIKHKQSQKIMKLV
jgi:hypothetical protein